MPYNFHGRQLAIWQESARVTTADHVNVSNNIAALKASKTRLVVRKWLHAPQSASRASNNISHCPNRLTNKCRRRVHNFRYTQVAQTCIVLSQCFGQRTVDGQTKFRVCAIYTHGLVEATAVEAASSSRLYSHMLA